MQSPAAMEDIETKAQKNGSRNISINVLPQLIGGDPSLFALRRVPKVLSREIEEHSDVSIIQAVVHHPTGPPCLHNAGRSK
jgi:hypothetical protein